ncbi:MAG TPA: hypothetical protein VMF70_00480 [Gemmatimonadales bacterium]|nr:hypothetical protein [Gemmatimonadales bacterium]
MTAATATAAGGCGRRAVSALAAVALAACAHPPAPPAPEGAYVPVSPREFAAAAARTAPGAPALLTIRWRYDDGDTPVSGRGAVRLEPPDTLRLDVGVPVVGRATLVLAGDSAWSKPGALVRQVLPSRSLVWAMFGVVRPPDSVASVERSEAADHRVYRVTDAGGVITTLELRGDTLLGASAARGERAIGRLALTRDSTGAVVRAETVDLEHSIRFVMDVDRRESGGAFPSEIWRRP